MKAFHLIIIYFLSVGLLSAHNISTGKNSLSGTVTDKINGEALIGVNVYFPELKKGAITDDEGRYRITNLPSIKTTIQVTYIGHQPIVQTINLSEITVLDFVMDESNARINEVVVTALTGNSLMQRTPTPISLVSKSKLLQNSSSNIIDALTIEPGISQITTGNAISKPVIRGLGYNRVVVVNDGVRQEGQQWGDEHGIEIDGQSVNSVEILKGPATLMYGSDAMAGVIHFLPAPILPDGKRELGLYSEYQTNNGLFNNSLHLAGNENGFVWNWRYSDKRAHSYKNKYDGYAFNSGFQEKALTGLLGLNKGWGYSHLTLSYFHQTPGIVTGNRDTETGKLTRPTVVDEKYTNIIASDEDGKSYGHFVPYQEIYHYKGVLNNNFIIGNGNLKSIIGYQQNRRQEFEDVFDKENYALYFQLHTLNYDIRYLFPEYNGYKIITGINGMYQTSFNKGHETLLPEYNIFDMGLFAVLSKNFGKLDISGGIRYDIRHKNVKEFHPHIHHHHGEEEEHGHEGEEEHEHGGHDHEHEDEIFPAFSKNFAGISGSLGIAYQISDDWYTKLNFARGFRAPNISELSAQGSHGGTIRFEIGNRDLKAENSWQIDWGLGYSSPIVSGEISLFFNRINNYIFSHKLVDDHGHDLITDGLKTYQFTSGDARIMGGEIKIDIHPIERIHFQNSFSYVNSVQLNQPDSTKYLPFTPAPKWVSDLRFDLIRHGKLFNNTYISIGLEHNFKQDNFYSANRTETATPSYTLLNAGLGTDIMYKGKRRASIFFTASNITDKAYQNHLSRLKYADINSVTGREGVFNMGRNFSFKLLIPVTF